MAETFLDAADPNNLVGSTPPPVLVKTNQRSSSDAFTATESSRDLEVRCLPPEQPWPTASLSTQQPSLAADLERPSPANSCPSQPASRAKQSCVGQQAVSATRKGQCIIDGSVLPPVCAAAQEFTNGAYAGKHGCAQKQQRSEQVSQ